MIAKSRRNGSKLKQPAPHATRPEVLAGTTDAVVDPHRYKLILEHAATYFKVLP